MTGNIFGYIGKSLYAIIDEDNSEAICENSEALKTNMPNNPLISREKAAYFAGFFDSDGLVHIEKQVKPQYPQGLYYGCVVKIEVQIEHKKSILREIQSIFGGVLKDTRNNSLLLYFGVNEAEVFLKTIYPFLIVKKPQTALWFKFREVLKQKIKNGHRLSLMEKLADKITSLHNSEIGPSGKVRPDWKDNETDSYAAGLIDGDGSIGFSSTGGLTVQLTGKPKSLPEWLQNVYGGSLNRYNSLDGAKYWKWASYGNDARNFVAKVIDKKSYKGLKIESELTGDCKSLLVTADV